MTEKYQQNFAWQIKFWMEHESSSNPSSIPQSIRGYKPACEQNAFHASTPSQNLYSVMTQVRLLNAIQGQDVE